MNSGERTLDRLRRAFARGRAAIVLDGSDERLRVRTVPDSACRVACPAGVNVKAYVGLVAAGDPERALEVVRERNPLPGICGRVCTHPCESECRRREVDEPVAIRQLKRFIADFALGREPAGLPPETPVQARSVAVVGSGPAGLTAANDLARLGYRVTVFEALDRPGGMLRVGIPPFRLPHDIIDQEVDAVRRLGVRFETRSRIEDPRDLLVDEYAAVFYAIGAHRGIDLGVEREAGIAGVVDCLDLLREANTGTRPRLAGSVLVVGGGNSAIDAARTALRLGAKDVAILYRRTRKEMPADDEEIEDALAEGIRIRYLVQPVRLRIEDDRARGLVCVRTRLGPPDDSGRRRPEPIPDSEFELDASLVIKAIGQRPATEPLADTPVTIARSGTVTVDPDTQVTGIPGLYAGGDVATGPSTVIDAIAAGHRAARGIHSFLTGRPLTTHTATARELEALVPSLAIRRVERTRPTRRTAPAKRSFKEIELTFTRAEASAEATRCLRCGPCTECFRCHVRCSRRQVALALPGTDADLVVRLPEIECVFPDELAPRSLTVIRPGANPLRLQAVPLVSWVDTELCRGCGVCLTVCPSNALRDRPPLEACDG